MLQDKIPYGVKYSKASEVFHLVYLRYIIGSVHQTGSYSGNILYSSYGRCLACRPSWLSKCLAIFSSCMEMLLKYVAFLSSYGRSIGSTKDNSTECELVFSLSTSNNCLRLLLALLVFSVSSPTTCFRRRFVSKMWPIWLAFLHFIVRRVFDFSLDLCNISSFFTLSGQIYVD